MSDTYRKPRAPRMTFPRLTCIGCGGFQPDPEAGYCAFCITALTIDYRENQARIEAETPDPFTTGTDKEGSR